MNYASREQEVQKAISSLLKVAIDSVNVHTQLKNILKILTNLPWLSFSHKGAIFLVGSKNNLVMVAHHALPEELQKRCELIEFGECMCGQAAQKKEILFRNCVKDEHTIRYDGMKDHGHYNIPLLSENNLLGVIVLYVPYGHVQKKREATFVEMLGNVVSSIITKDILEKRAEVGQYALKESQSDVISRLLTASDLRDNATGKHIQRMTNYSLVIGRQIGLTPHQLQELEMGAPMHDVGKIGIRDSILLKTDQLTDDEFEIMKQHTVIGSRILSGSTGYLKAAGEIALSHHEKWDGSGYPYGKKGLEIPLNGRICAIADVFDALTTKRPYKEKWSLDKAFEFIKNHSGHHFDPELVEVFLASRKEITKFQVIYGDDIINPSRKLSLPHKKAIPGGVKWSSDLELGIDVLDEHHRYLISLINGIYLSNLQGKGVSETFTAITKMNEYADIHFAEEEKFMKYYEYPGLDEQIEQHHYFLAECENFMQSFEMHALTIGIEIVLFLKTWLVSHIKEEDTKIRDWMCNRKFTSE